MKRTNDITNEHNQQLEKEVDKLKKENANLNEVLCIPKYIFIITVY